MRSARCREAGNSVDSDQLALSNPQIKSVGSDQAKLVIPACEWSKKATAKTLPWQDKIHG